MQLPEQRAHFDERDERSGYAPEAENPEQDKCDERRIFAATREIQEVVCCVGHHGDEAKHPYGACNDEHSSVFAVARVAYGEQFPHVSGRLAPVDNRASIIGIDFRIDPAVRGAAIGKPCGLDTSQNRVER
jgi:hypothetical protein